MKHNIPLICLLFILTLTNQRVLSQANPELNVTVKGILVDSVSKETIP